MAATAEHSLELAVHAIRRGVPETDGYEPVTIASSRGEICGRYFGAAEARCGVVLIASSAWDSPGRGQLYPRLCASLAESGVAGLWLRLRRPGVLEESVLDALAGMYFLAEQGVTRFALVGHGFGGAVAAQAAANGYGVRALATLATQAEGMEAAAALPGECASLFIHGADDPVQPRSSSQYGYELAREPRFLRIFGGAGHCLDEVAEELQQELCDWLLGELREC
jgi:pimeloyl-ACP methyl ester carboxylesterase